MKEAIGRVSETETYDETKVTKISREENKVIVL